MQNRRNYYRILQVQPDAPTEAIKNNYRTLLQKLRLHPDLGGDQSNASLINQAWQTLRDPTQRSTYDKQLLQDYHIQVLSQGSLASDTKTRIHGTKTIDLRNINQRNYYRILNIQTDAPAAIIDASYRHQIKKPPVPIKLLHDAYAVLSNPEKRQIYDQFLRRYTHVHVLKKKNSVKRVSPAEKEKYPELVPASSNAPVNHSDAAYQPIITDYCYFCKTPFTVSSAAYGVKFCIECSSPLFGNPDTDFQQFERSLSRINWEGKLTIYTDWPARGHYGTLTNLSPDGLGFTTSQPLQPDQVIKVDNEHFKCISKVIYCKNIGTDISIGSHFVTVLFNRQQGTFISTQA